MTDIEIIKALECCADDSVIRCEECLYGVSIFSCRQMQLKKDSLDLINRQKAEIEQLNTVNAEMQAEIGRMKNNAFCNVIIDEETMRNIVKEKVAEFELDIKSIKAEAIKEFAERLKEKAFADKYYEHESIVYLADIDNLVKEMVGDTE